MSEEESLFCLYLDYQSVDHESAVAIKTFTGMDLTIPAGKEVNMCKAVEEMVRDYKAEGKAEGIVIGQGSGKLQTLYDLVQSGDITPERAIERAKEYNYKGINTMDDLRRQIEAAAAPDA